MIQNLSKSSKVIGYDSNQQWTKNLTMNANIHQAKNVPEVAAQADTIITMLPNDKIVRLVAADIYKHKNKLIIDSSTISPFAAQDLKKLANGSGNEFADAPVSGGVGGAANATLTFMVGADETLFNKVHPVLS